MKTTHIEGSFVSPLGRIDRSDENTVQDESELRALIRRALPADAVNPRPQRIVGGVLVLVSVLSGSFYLALARPPLVLALGVALVLGNLYVTLMFYGHEVAHGTILRSSLTRNAFQYFSLLIYAVSPHLWKYWHNCTHHPNTNIPTRDPDCFPPLDVEKNREGVFVWLARRINPGSGHWLSFLNLFVAFFLQGQLVLWRDSSGWRHHGFKHRRAIVDSLSMILFWLALGFRLGFRSAVLVIILPMLIANFGLMAYVHTNHMLRPLGDSLTVLDSSMSVTTLRFLDFVHLHFSHHVEHHLFPNISHHYYPRVRELLLRYAPEKYLAPTHWRALRVLYSTPRVFCVNRGFVNPIDGSSVPLSSIEKRLRGGSKRRAERV
jgi:fatty acid desaturase